MRILHLISTSGFYGAERVVTSLASQLALRGCDVTIGLFNGAEVRDRSRFAGTHSRSVALWDLRCKGRFDIAALIALVRQLRSRHIDILHSHGYKANLYGLLAARMAGCRIVSTCHNWTNRSLRLTGYGLLDRHCLPLFDYVFAVSETVAQEIRKTRLLESKLKVICNGIEVDGFRGERGLEGTPWPPVLACLSRLSTEKAIDVLVRALPSILRSFPGTVCNVAGDGPEHGRLTALGEELGVSASLRLLGFCSDTRELLAGCTVYVHPSRIEGLPLALLEAMASSRPIVATAVGGVPALLQGGELGILVPPDDPDALAGGVLKLLADPPLREKLSKRAASFVKSRYDVSAMAEEYHRVYTSILSSHMEQPGKVPPLDEQMDAI